MLHASSCIARDWQVLRAIRSAHQQIGEKGDDTQVSGVMRRVEANLHDTSNTAKIS